MKWTLSYSKFDRFAISDLHPAVSADGLVSSHPLRVTVGNPNEIFSISDAISYSKQAELDNKNIDVKEFLDTSYELSTGHCHTRFKFTKHCKNPAAKIPAKL